MYSLYLYVITWPLYNHLTFRCGFVWVIDLDRHFQQFVSFILWLPDLMLEGNPKRISVHLQLSENGNTWMEGTNHDSNVRHVTGSHFDMCKIHKSQVQHFFVWFFLIFYLQVIYFLSKTVITSCSSNLREYFMAEYVSLRQLRFE